MLPAASFKQSELESLRSGSRSMSGSLESSSGREYVHPSREEGWVDVVLILLSAPRSIGSTSTLPREVDLTLAQLDLLLFLLCLGRLGPALKLRGLGGVTSPPAHYSHDTPLQPHPPSLDPIVVLFAADAATPPNSPTQHQASQWWYRGWSLNVLHLGPHASRAEARRSCSVAYSPRTDNYCPSMDFFHSVRFCESGCK